MRIPNAACCNADARQTVVVQRAAGVNEYSGHDRQFFALDEVVENSRNTPCAVGCDSKVFSAIGSFVDIRGGGAYPDLIRQADVKPLRVSCRMGPKIDCPNNSPG